MGVLNCSRNGCENIMCDRYSYKYGYICGDCFEELVNSRTLDIQGFMNSEKREQIEVDFREIYEKEFSFR